MSLQSANPDNPQYEDARAYLFRSKIDAVAKGE